MKLSILPGLSVSSSTITWSVFGGALVLFGVFTLILLYHWTRYAEKKSVFIIALMVYVAISAFIISGLMIGALMLGV